MQLLQQSRPAVMVCQAGEAVTPQAAHICKPQCDMHVHAYAQQQRRIDASMSCNDTGCDQQHCLAAHASDLPAHVAQA